MQEPSLRTSRIAIAVALAAIFLVGGAGFLIGRGSAPSPDPAATPAAPVTVEVPPAPPAQPLVLGRAEIIALAQQAADAFAAGRPLPAEVEQAAGKRFDLPLPFGCTGPDGADGRQSLRWSYDAEEEVLRVSASPERWPAGDWAGTNTGTGTQAAAGLLEGFWISRPWLTGDTCPVVTGRAAPTGTEPVTLPGQTLAVAQFLPDADAEGESARTFETVKRLRAEEFDGSKGFRLRLIGRVDELPGAGPARCMQPAGIEQRPICLFAMRLDEVKIENAASDEVLATWTVRRPG